MRDLEQIIDIAYNNRDEIADMVSDAFSNTIGYNTIGSMECPDFEIYGYEEYLEEVANAIMGCFGDSWDNAEEQIVVDNVAKIMSEIDVDILSEDDYTDKGFEYANEQHEIKYENAREAYLERRYENY